MNYFHLITLVVCLIFLPSIFDMFVKIFTLVLFFVAWLLNGIYQIAKGIAAKTAIIFK